MDIIQNSDPSKDVTIEVGDLEITGDLKIIFFDKTIDKEKEVFHFWFNTAFIDENKLHLTKAEIDKAWNDKKSKKYSTEFTIDLSFKGADESAMSKLKSGVSSPV